MVIASDTTQTYHVAIVGYLACGLVLTSSSVNSLIYSSNGAKEATAAGHILLSMVNVCHQLPSPFPKSVLTTTDCVDLLFRINPLRRTSSIPRLLRSPQRSQNLARWKGNELWKWNWKRTTRHLDLIKRSTPDVHIGSTRWIRDFIARCRIPRWTSRSRSQLVPATIRQHPYPHQQPRSQRTHEQRATATNTRGSRSANRISIPSEGHLLVRGQPRRCQRDLLLQARNIRSLRRQREVVAGQERKRRYGYSTIKLLDSVISCLRRSLFLLLYLSRSDGTR